MSEKTKICFELTKRGIREFAKLALITGATRKEIFNSATALLKWAVKERLDGRIIVSMDEKKGSYKEIKLLVLSKVTEE